MGAPAGEGSRPSASPRARSIGAPRLPIVPCGPADPVAQLTASVKNMKRRARNPVAQEGPSPWRRAGCKPFRAPCAARAP